MLPNQGCDAPAQGTPFVDASGKAKQGTVTGLSLSSTYDCYAIADPKLLKKDKCSKPVRITTLGSSTLVYTTSVTQVNGRRKLLQGSSTALTSRCFVGPTGNFTECIDSGLDNNTVIYDGVVDPNKQFIVFDSYSLNSPSSFEGLITCPLSPAGIIDPTTCMDAYTPPSGYEAEFVFDPLARRVWFVLYPKGRGYSDDLLGTCAITAQGEFTGCAQSQAFEGTAIIPGSSPDASGFYVKNFTQAGEVFAFCKNDLSLPCDAVTGIPVLGGDENFVDSVRFLTDSVVYFTASMTNFTTWDTTYITYRCNANNPTTFTECQKVFEAPDMLLELVAPANGGSNAYVLEDNFASMSNDPVLKVCDVNQGTGVFENCKVVLGTEYFGGKPELYPYLVTSSPIVF